MIVKVTVFLKGSNQLSEGALIVVEDELRIKAYAKLVGQDANEHRQIQFEHLCEVNCLSNTLE